VPFSEAQAAAFSVSFRENSWLWRGEFSNFEISSNQQQCIARADTENAYVSGRKVPTADPRSMEARGNLRYKRAAQQKGKTPHSGGAKLVKGIND
jgi:hypothetical protein